MTFVKYSKIDRETLDKVLENHKRWHELRYLFEKEDEIELKADLSYVDLSGVDLSGADLRDANLSHTNLKNADLRDANLASANLASANLQNAKLNGARLFGAKLERAVLENADLEGANLDYTSLPLWQASLSANFDSRQLKQLIYHVVKAGLHSKNATEEDKAELSKLIEYANQSHLVEDYGDVQEEHKSRIQD